jgi:hypothetical protein
VSIIVTYPNSGSNCQRQIFCGQDTTALAIAHPGHRSVRNRLRSRTIWVGAVAAFAFVLPFLAAAPQANAGPVWQWYAQVKQHLDAEFTALVKINDFFKTKGSGQPNIELLASGCTQLHRANDALRDHTPTPNPKLTSVFNQLIENADATAQHCANFLMTPVVTHEQKARQEFEAFAKFFDETRQPVGQLLDTLLEFPESA